MKTESWQLRISSIDGPFNYAAYFNTKESCDKIFYEIQSCIEENQSKYNRMHDYFSYSFTDDSGIEYIINVFSFNYLRYNLEDSVKLSKEIEKLTSDLEEKYGTSEPAGIRPSILREK